ncbi:MAG: sulfatase [Armatimonadota bacterium]|jgi:arylsulfatase A-like enzyme
MNVLLITADTLRADHMSAYGYWRETSPNLTALAREGVRFDRFIGQCAHTLPSFTSMLTGLTPFETGVVATLHCVPDTPSGRLSDETPTLAETLAKAGVHTAAVDNLMQFACHPSWFVRGFGEYVNPNPESFVTALIAERMNDVLLPVIERQREPFFLWAHYWDPHRPYNQPDEYLRPFTDDGSEQMRRAPDGREYIPTWGTLEALEQSSWDYGRQLDHQPDRIEDARGMIDAYDGEIRYLDEHLGRVFDALEASGRWDDTCVIFTADHGETMADHLTHFAHVEALDACTRIPMIIKPPAGMETAESVGGLATHTDIPATILDLLGVEPEIEMHGKSLLPLITGEAGAVRGHVVSSGMYLLDRDDVWKSIEVSVRTERWRLRLRAPLGDDYPMRGLELSRLWEVVARLYEDEPEYELYDVASDPDELTDVAPDHPEVVAELDALLEPAVSSRYFFHSGESDG